MRAARGSGGRAGPASRGAVVSAARTASGRWRNWSPRLSSPSSVKQINYENPRTAVWGCVCESLLCFQGKSLKGVGDYTPTSTKLVSPGRGVCVYLFTSSGEFPLDEFIALCSVKEALSRMIMRFWWHNASYSEDVTVNI